VSKLTDKQQKFCEEYLIDLNATQAAIRAGYSEKTAFTIGCENLKKPYIAEYIAEKQKESSHRNAITADFVLNGIKDIALLGESETNRLKAFGMLGDFIGLKDNKRTTDENTDGVLTVEEVSRQIGDLLPD